MENVTPRRATTLYDVYAQIDFAARKIVETSPDENSSCRFILLSVGEINCPRVYRDKSEFGIRSGLEFLEFFARSGQKSI